MTANLILTIIQTVCAIITSISAIKIIFKLKPMTKIKLGIANENDYLNAVRKR